ncbi:sigma-54-dependent Fis family transcriptional regulator [Desulfonatronum sp. SC1]|uniref:sigma-54 interaction domain-containing protein n=1 Tax=Desulfonatronum sp. SC1 TaxID=2109626 RepID=UPI000D3194ED|nr:sigma 54-interacting transcriptional regulator [Desulfonatronum sp. SC1]PTN37521.1 sigma-54-dependent Fis family transcriptional regulator [Desulfonatronum sp. SC1]
MARSTGFHVSLVVLVPVIVAGTAVLTLFLSSYAPPFQRDFLGNLHWVALLIAATTSTSCALLLYVILRPVRRFLASARKSGVIPDRSPDSAAPAPRSDLEEYRLALEQVGLALSRLDAKALFPEIVAQSRSMRSVLGQIMKVAPTTTSVLLTGESGTGKELAARAIHAQSGRRDGPLIPINCAAIPENLLESELFGYEKGAFTGAATAKQGKFELAHGGTLFLDEIGDMPLSVQAKILRMLETGSVERIGGTKTIRCDVRIVAATNRNIADMARRGTFRDDLLHRLNVFPLHLPPLRERREDIPQLADHFLTKPDHAPRLSGQALSLLMAHDWPGNARELRNVLERAAVLADYEELRPEHLPGLGPSPATPPIADKRKSTCLEDDSSLDHRLETLERSMIESALARTDGVQSKAARLLGIKERSLWHRIKKLEIDAKAFKSNE